MARTTQILASLSSVGKVYKDRSNSKVANRQSNVNRDTARIVLFARSSIELLSHATNTSEKTWQFSDKSRRSYF